MNNALKKDKYSSQYIELVGISSLPPASIVSLTSEKESEIKIQLELQYKEWIIAFLTKYQKGNNGAIVIRKEDVDELENIPLTSYEDLQNEEKERIERRTNNIINLLRH
jgi:hypothetical protein